MFAKFSITIVFLLSSTVALMAQTDFNFNTKTIPDHPRLLLKRGEEQRIQQLIATDSIAAKVHRAIIAECESIIPLPTLKRIQTGRRLLHVSRECIRRVFYLSYAYRMTGKVEYVVRAELELFAVAAFKDWNPSHFLDVAEMTLGMAIGYDWLYNDLSRECREQVREAILQKGILPSMDSSYNGFLKVKNNWNQVCNAGISYGVIAVFEEDAELSNKIINRAIQSIHLPMEDYAPDGAYPEGYNYWGYGTSFNVLFISAMEKLAGTDYGLIQQPGFLSTADYYLQMSGPTGQPFNYSDATAGKELQPAMFWFAAKRNDPSLLWAERKAIEKTKTSGLTDNRLLPALLVWSTMNASDKAPAVLSWTGHGKTPVSLMRSSWTDPKAIFIGIKGGSADVSHAHMDVGSFVMEADGIRWAIDPGMQDYESLESKGLNIFGRGQNAQRWKVYRNTNYIHNTLTVDSQLQRVQGKAAIIASSTKASPFSIIDLSEVYKDQLAFAKRGAAIRDNSYVEIRDEIKATSKGSTVRWQILTKAKVNIVAPNKVILEQNGQRLIIQTSLPGVQFETWSTNPPRDYDAANTGTILVGFEIPLQANEERSISVYLVPGSAGLVSPPVARSLDEWKSK